MTRLLDRYVLGIFLPALAIFTVTLLFLFVAVDFASKMGRFLELKNVSLLGFILGYYVVRLPMLLSILLPAVMLFAPTFTIVKLARSNEILPIAASGTSLRRMCLPFLVAALFASATIAAMDEFVLPRLGERITEDEEIMMSRGFAQFVEDYDGQTKIWATRYDVGPRILSGEVRITRLDDSAQPIEVVSAQRCQWDPKRRRWVAFDGTVEYPLAPLIHPPGEKPRTRKDVIPAEGFVIESRLKPETVRKSTSLSSRFAFATFAKLREDVRRYPHVPSCTLKVHQRFAFPLAPLVLVLLGLPFVMDPHSKSFIKGLIFCFLLAIGYYMTHFACVDLGNVGTIPPVIAAWLPTALFGAGGLLAFSRMKT